MESHKISKMIGNEVQGGRLTLTGSNGIKKCSLKRSTGYSSNYKNKKVGKQDCESSHLDLGRL